MRRTLKSSARLRLAAVLSGLAAAAGAATGCGSDESTDPAADAGPVHVHGLGVNSGDSSLYIATHTGLFRMAQGSEEAERVGDSYQDTMGFTVVGADRFLGSGHPDLRTDLPPCSASSSRPTRERHGSRSRSLGRPTSMRCGPTGRACSATTRAAIG